jgi:arsenate reductase-like glutaredoxin family protein
LRRGIPFEYHDLEDSPLSKPEIVALMRKSDGSMRDPLVEIGGRLILGCDKDFIDRVLRDHSDAPLPASKVYGRAGSPRTNIALDYMRERGLAPQFHDLDAQPLDDEQLLDLMYLPRLGSTRAPIIVHRSERNPERVHIILGGDVEHIIEVFG